MSYSPKKTPVDLTAERREKIDSMSYEDLLRHWRHAPVGDPWFQGETAEYWEGRMRQLRKEGVDHVAASKAVGWDGFGR